MNAIATSFDTSDRLGWQPSFERLELDCEAARTAGRHDPWAIIEAECWLDLIDAKLSADSTRADPALRAQLADWRGRIVRLL